MRKGIVRVVAVFVLSYLFNFVWESVHARFLYEGIVQLSTTNFFKLMAYASFVDAFWIGVIFLAGSFLFEKWFVFERKQVLFFVACALVVAVVIEVRALAAHRWAYTALMPTVFGVGLSPLVQLAVAGVLASFIVMKFVY